MRDGKRAILFNDTITVARTAEVETAVVGLAGARSLAIEAQLAYGSGGTTVDIYVQTSIDGGVSWFDIANFHFTTSTAKKLSAVTMNPATPFTAGAAPGSGALTANTVLDGIIGDRLRALVTTTGTYGGGTVARCDVVVKE